MTDEIIDEQVKQATIDFSNFAQALNSIYPNVFTPQLINARMQDVTTMGGIKISEDIIKDALNNPKDSERTLLGLSEAFENKSTSYRRILQYVSDLPQFALTYYCKNIKDPSEYKSAKYQKDLDILKQFTYNFDYVSEFAKVTKQLFREETFFGVLRDEGKEKYTLQQLPSDYCLITGKWDYSPVLFSFNYIFFQLAGTSFDMWPDVMKSTYSKLFLNTSGGPRLYDPAISVDQRSQSTWVMYGDCSPMDGFWGWKLNSAVAVRVPYFSALFQSFVNQDLIRALQKNSYLASAAKLVLGEIETLSKDQKAVTANSLSMTPETLGRFLALVQSAIKNEAVRVGAAPMSNMQAMEFSSNDTIYSSWLHATLGESGINSNLLFSGDVKPNAIETQMSANVDEMLSEGIYPFFNSFMEFQVNKRVDASSRGSHYHFGFNFEGSNFYLDKQRRFETQMSLMQLGVVNVQKLAASMGQNPFAFQSQLDEARINGWTQNLTPIVLASQLSGKDNNTGRPKSSDSEISDSGMQTRDDGSNIGRGGKE